MIVKRLSLLHHCALSVPWAFACLFLLGPFTFTLGSLRAAPPANQKVTTKQAAAEFQQLDITEDGVLTGTEAKSVRQFDQNGDGRITKSEYLAGRTQSTPEKGTEAAAPAANVPPKRPATPWDKKLAAQFDAGKRWALLIGVNKYAKNSLRFCVADAKLLADTLVENCGYDRKRVVQLTDDQPEAQQPKKANIQREAAEFLKKIGEQDTVLICFSGHGFSHEGQSFLCPQDFDDEHAGLTGWRFDELRAMLHDCRAAQKILLIDCCHSGGAIMVAGTAPTVKEMGAAFEHAQGLITISASRTNEESLEIGAKKHGIFTLMAVEGLRGGADFDANGIIDSDELYRHVLSTVPIAADEVQPGHKQTPVRLIGQDVVGVFALSRPSSNLKPTIDPGEPKPGDTVINSIGMKLVRLPTGTFVMGSPPDEYLRHEDEIQRPVIVGRQIWMGAFEVTQDEYRKVMRGNPSYHASGADGAERVKGFETGRFPVEQVTWDEAAEFCRRLSASPDEKRLGRKYRLPHEYEWEFACRSNMPQAFSVGELIDSKHANIRADQPYWDAPAGVALKRSRTVGSYPPNGFGLYDIHGNVAEWCDDWYAPRPYNRQLYSWNFKSKTSADTVQLLEEFSEAVKGAERRHYLNPESPRQGETRILRGGSFLGDVASCRSAARRHQNPEYRQRTIGFRVVCE